MSDYKEKYINRSKKYGETVRESRINSTKYLLTSTFKDSANYYNVPFLLPDAPYGDEQNIDVHIIDKSDVRDEKIVATPYESPVLCGGIIDWKGVKWITYLADEMSEVYKRCLMRRCFSTIKWIDDEGKTIEECFAFKSDTPSNFGVQEMKLITLPNERRQIMLRRNDDTNKIVKDQRFIIDGRAWKVVSLDRMSMDGILLTTLDEDVNILPDDNSELGIANYNTRLKEDGSVEPQGTAFILETEPHLYLNQTKTFIVTKKESNEASSTLELSECTVSENEELASIVSFDETSVVIKAGKRVGNFNVTCITSDNEVETFTIQIKPLV